MAMEDSLNWNSLDNVANNQKVEIASIHLYDKALDWHIFKKMNGLEVPWERYEEEILNSLADTYCLENLQKATNEAIVKSKPVFTSYRNTAYASSAINSGGNVGTSVSKPLLALPPPQNNAIRAISSSANQGRRQLSRRQLSKKEYEEKEGSNSNEQLQTKIKEPLDDFADVFVVPKCLPPNISLDHIMPLKDGVTSFNIRPYRYPHKKKTQLKQWSRQLNQQIVKDKLSIPMIEKLIDELYGSKVFSKLDLRIGTLAYKLELPSTTHVHLVFHVLKLKKCHSTDLSMGTLPMCDTGERLAVTPYKLLDRKLAKQGNRAVIYGLITVEDATWELLTDLEKQFPEFDLTLEVKGLLKEGQML
ncbi:hypothetical protein Tco_0991733 [Tanacetum coccineum]|uniref:Tf2-1-like SH3-like domain-containing protein n=1 Tax=Tanacetum coccineum TaxID=301880 RepID=A0ABQ5F0V2_9ASTR